MWDANEESSQRTVLAMRARTTDEAWRTEDKDGELEPHYEVHHWHVLPPTPHSTHVSPIPEGTDRRRPLGSTTLSSYTPSYVITKYNGC